MAALSVPTWGPTGPGGLSPLHNLNLKGQGRDRRALAQASVEVEAQFLSQLLEGLRRSLVRSVTTLRCEQTQGYQSLADQHLARAMAWGGGLGLARRLCHDLKSRYFQDPIGERNGGHP